MSAIITIFFIGIVIILSISSYNKIVELDQSVRASYGDLASILERRKIIYSDLENLIKNGSDFELMLQRNIVAARNDSDRVLEKSNVLAIAEAYPSADSINQRTDFQKIVTQIENLIQTRIKIYNTKVEKYNSYIESIPQFIIAQLFGWTPCKNFDATNDIENWQK